jgi:hypothetical protein
MYQLRYIDHMYVADTPPPRWALLVNDSVRTLAVVNLQNSPVEAPGGALRGCGGGRGPRPEEEGEEGGGGGAAAVTTRWRTPWSPFIAYHDQKRRHRSCGCRVVSVGRDHGLINIMWRTPVVLAAHGGAPPPGPSPPASLGAKWLTVRMTEAVCAPATAPRHALNDAPCPPFTSHGASIMCMMVQVMTAAPSSPRPARCSDACVRVRQERRGSPKGIAKER